MRTCPSTTFTGARNRKSAWMPQILKTSHLLLVMMPLTNLEGDEGDDLEGYKMITPPGCPVCIMSNAESEGKPSELTPQKILEILMTYMAPADARKTFDEMMVSTATTTQGNQQSASSSAASGSGLGL